MLFDYHLKRLFIQSETGFEDYALKGISLFIFVPKTSELIYFKL